MKRNFFISMVLVLFSIFIVGTESFAAKSLYDDFSGTYIDSQKWNDLEQVREISNGKLHLNVKGSGEQVTILIDPVDKTNYLEAKVLIESGSQMAQTQGHTRLVCIPYNESRGPGSGQDYDGLSGDAWVTNRIVLDENRNLSATAGVWRFDDPDDGNIGTSLFWELFSTHIDFDTEYILSIEFTSSELIFKCNDETLIYQVPTPVYPSHNNTRSIRSRVYSGGSGYIKAQIDDVYISKGGLPYDDFEAASIDPSKWEHLTLLREIESGKLRLNVQADGSRTDATIHPNHQATAYLEAKVLVESGSQVSPGARGIARIAGDYYNESRGPGSGQDYDEAEGNVWVDNRITLDDNHNLTASCFASRSDTPDGWGPSTTLFSQDFTIPIAFDTEYTLSIEFTGSTLIFKCNDETYQYDIATPNYPPSEGQSRQLKSRVYAAPGESGYMMANFDDVYTGYTTEATYDATGTWDMIDTDFWDSCDPDEQPETITVTITQTGNDVTLVEDEDEVEITGTVSGAYYTLEFVEPGETGIVSFTLSSSTSGSGYYNYADTEGPEWCEGGGLFTLTKRGTISGQIDPASSGYIAGDDIYVMVLDAPWPQGSVLAYTVLTDTGAYTLDLPTGIELYVYILWDKDHSESYTPGDWIGEYGYNPITLDPGQNLTDIDVSLENEVPPASPSGEVTCDNFQAGQGQIYIGVFDGPDPGTDHSLGGTSITAPGSYTVSNLPVGGAVWVYAYWDANGSGADGPDLGDYTGSYVDNPVTVSSAGNTGIGIDLAEEFRPEPGTISGTVLDQLSGEPLDDASSGSTDLDVGWHKFVYRQAEVGGFQASRAAFKAPGDTDWKWFSTSELDIRISPDGENGIILINKRNTSEYQHPRNHGEMVQCVDIDATEEGGWYGESVVSFVNHDENIHGDDDNYTSYYEGYFYVNTAGTWFFSTDSDDASEIVIDDQVVAHWYDGHGPADRWEHKYMITIYRHDSHEWLDSTCGNPDGSYTFRGLSPGSYVVGATAPGYINEFFQEAVNWDEATPVVLTASEGALGINLTLLPDMDLDGMPDDWESTHFGDLSHDGSGDWDSDRLADLQEYQYGTNPNDFDSDDDGVSDGDEVNNGTDPTNASDYTPAGTGVISGTVYQTDGSTPITEDQISVEVISGDPCGGRWTHRSTLTNPADGTYAIANIAPASDYYLQTNNMSQSNYINEWWTDGDPDPSSYDCNLAQSVTVSSEGTETGKDFKLDLGGSIEGTVYQSNGTTPVTGVHIDIQALHGDPCGWRQHITSAWTDQSDGTYTIMGLPPGDYYLQTNNMNQSNYVNEWWTGDPDPSSYDCNLAQSVTVSSEGTETADFQLDLGGSIEGTVYQSDGTMAVTGVEMQVNAIQGDPCGEQEHLGWANTSTSDGTYTLMGLPPGTYYLQTDNMNQSNYVNEWWTGDTDPSSYDCNLAQSVTVSSEGTETGKDFKLDLGGSIEGTVKNSNGTAPITDADIQVQAVSGDPCGGQQHLGWAQTDPSDGTYTVMGLPPGDYYLQTNNMNQSNYINEWWASAESTYDCSGAEPIEIASAGEDVTGKDFQLDIGGSISGTVYESGGVSPIPNLHVYATDYDTDQWRGGTHTEQDGNYTITGLPSGTYKARACASCSDLSYADECYQDAGWENATSVEVTAPNDTPNIDFSLTQMVPRATNQEAIEDGLAWLASIQNLDGSWGAEGTEYALAKTALAVLSFETYAKEQGYSSPFDTEYKYHAQVENGLDYIFANAHTTTISPQLAGNPDGDGDGIGVYFNMSEDWHTTYYTSIAMMAIAASNAPDSVVSVTGSLVDGLTYKDVLQDMVDYLAWGQTDAGNGRGGWNYGATNNDNTRSDQSNTGWVTLALAYAEYAEADPPEGFGLTIPGFVRTELGFWINFIQDDVDDDDNDGGSYYDGSSGDGTNMLRTGNLLQQMAFVGDTGATQRVQDAIDYMVRHWEGGWNWNPICYQATYTTMKGLEALGVETIDAINWFQDFSDAIRSEQSIHGWWPICCFDDGEKILSTEWAIMTLQKTIPPTEENPDLEVVKSEQWVDEANGTYTYTVSYTIKNRGNIEAPAGHDVGLTIDGADVEQKVVPVTLASGASYSDSFETTLSGVRDEITVCADINGEVDELNEANNCATNIWPPPIKGDLNGDRDVDLADAILALQVLTGLNPEGVDSRADVDGDGEIGLAELIYILQTVAHLR